MYPDTSRRYIEVMQRNKFSLICPLTVYILHKSQILSTFDATHFD